MYLRNVVIITKVLIKYFIGYQEGEISYFVIFFIKDDEVWEKYEQIWDVIKNKLDIKFHSLPVYDTKYLKTKVKEYEKNVGEWCVKKISIIIALLALQLILLWEWIKKLSTSLFRRM